MGVKSYFLRAILLFLFQSIFEILVLIVLTWVGFPYLGHDYSSEHFINILMGILVFYGLAKIIYVMVPNILFFVLIASKTNWNLILLNGTINILIFSSITLINGRLSQMSSPIAAMIISTFLLLALNRTFNIGLLGRNRKVDSN